MWLAAALVSAPVLAQSGISAVSSSLVSLDAAAAAGKAPRVVAPSQDQQQVDLYERPVRPFSSIAMGVEAGTLGIGVEVATPLTGSFNLRAGTELLNFGDEFPVDSANYQGEAHLRSGHVAVDFHPFGGAFRISPQLLIFESSFAASVSVPGGNAFELGTASYVSDASDPVHGSAAISMGRRVMPALTIGWGNMLSRHSRRWSIPFEIGAAYTGHYAVNLSLAGTACITYVSCMSTSSDQVQQSVREEEGDLNETMKRFQIYPLLSTGFAYRF